MDCDINLDMIDAYLLDACEAAEYCAVNEVEDATEYIVRIGKKVYVMIIPK
jgi:hypothetical protein